MGQRINEMREAITEGTIATLVGVPVLVSPFLPEGFTRHKLVGGKLVAIYITANAKSKIRELEADQILKFVSSLKRMVIEGEELVGQL